MTEPKPMPTKNTARKTKGGVSIEGLNTMRSEVAPIAKTRRAEGSGSMSSSVMIDISNEVPNDWRGDVVVQGGEVFLIELQNICTRPSFIVGTGRRPRTRVRLNVNQTNRKAQP